MNKLLVAAFLCLLYVATRADAAFPIVDSGAWVRSGGNPVIYWMDSDRVLFLGHDRIKPQTGGEIRFAILQWVVGNQITVVRRDVDSLCYRPGQIRFVVSDKRTRTRTVYQGPLGKEEPVQSKSYDALNCDSSFDPKFSIGNRRIRKLRPGDGYLDLGPASNREAADTVPLIYMTSDGKRIELPFAQRDLIRGIQYYDFQNAYFFLLGYRPMGQTGATNVWPPGIRAKAYWMWPDGRTELVEFPGDIVSPQPTRAGMVYRITGLDERIKRAVSFSHT
jgi:hypothetical protein